jgi:hypothetical protein
LRCCVLSPGDKVAQRQRGPSPDHHHHHQQQQQARSPEPDDYPQEDADSPNAAAAAAQAGHVSAPVPAASTLYTEQHKQVNFSTAPEAGAGQQVSSDGRRGSQDAHKFGSKLEVRVSAGSDNSSESSGRGICGFSKRATWTALTVLLLVLMAGAGIGVGVAFAKGKTTGGALQQQGTGATAAAAAVAAASMSVFGVTARPALPGMSSEQRCRLWFGSSEVSLLASALLCKDDLGGLGFCPRPVAAVVL